MKLNGKQFMLVGAFIALTVVSVFAFTAPNTATAPEKTTEAAPAGGTYMMVTTIESIIPGGLGRSRMFTTDESGNMIEESKMKNFYSGVGINFGNINENDAAIIAMINGKVAEGWTLQQTVTGVQSPGGDNNNQGIFISRYIFMK